MKSPFRIFTLAAIGCLLAGTALATPEVEKKIWALLDDPKSVYVSLDTPSFMSLGAGFELPDGGKQVTALALAAPGGAFDPRDLEKIPAASLGYEAKWCVERYKHYNLDWDITGLRLTSLDPEAKKYPWLVIMNGGAANVYEFYVDLKNRPGWGQFLAQKLNVMIVSIPGNFKYGGWDEPVKSELRQPAYLLDKELSMEEYELRNCLLTNTNVMKGLKQLLMKNTTGDLLLIGHSTSGEMAMLANNDPELRARTNGRYLGWGSGGPARLDRVREAREGVSAGEDSARPARAVAAGSTPPGPRERTPLHKLSRRDAKGYSGGYSRWLNPLYEPGDSTYQIAEKWIVAEGRRRAQFKQQIQSIEHGGGIDLKGWIEYSIEQILVKTGNPWGVNLEEVSAELFSTHYTKMDGYDRMVWTVAHYDRNHWVPEDPMKSTEVFFANEYRRVNPKGEIRLIVWDPLMTHYGHVELPQQLASATYSVVRWLDR
ncbi:hypothetical protein Verru16b_02803 [Lacunisphaera limnophila]|uniref:Alpha/beta hydrolase family protein n=1 Tax=Lacunisphaera limnophila TaxID=1838286 RepID=A0A1D8AXU4_9BACT|nr:hypothetical protein [Lacunisphaera limnophila]AOS45716.1 hypothetical protein Verru16b_02803 [Lacunisphaera limnophila]